MIVPQALEPAGRLGVQKSVLKTIWASQKDGALA